MESPIVFEHVDKSYETPPSYVVRDFSLSIRAGEFFCLVGPSGCGKSTVLKLMAGIEEPSAGTVVRPERIGMVFQSYALLPWLTVEENVAFPARMLRFPEETIEADTVRYLDMVHLAGFAKKYPRELSGGQRQRVGIARSLIVNPNVLLLDEPFSALDPVITDELHEDLLKIWSATQKTIVLVTHHFDEAVTLADRVGIMRDGALETIVPITLPRPRNEQSAAFALEVQKMRLFLTAS